MSLAVAAWPSLMGTYVSSAVPQRVVLSLFGFFAIVNAYTMRHCLDLALTCMVASKNFTADVRPQLSSVVTKRPVMSVQKVVAVSAGYDWSEGQQTLIMMSFYVGYVLSHFPATVLAQKYGGKWLLSGGLMMAAVFTILTPVAVKLGGWSALIVVRVLIGISEGPTFPALSNLLAQWVPARERGTLGVLALSGGQMGIFLVNLISSLLLQRFGWKLVFYFFGGWTLIWFVCFITLCYGEPDTNPYIKEEERKYLKQEMATIKPRQELSAPPWKNILTSIPVWALTSTTIQYDWMQARVSSSVARSLRDIKQDSLIQSLQLILSASAPYILNWVVSLMSGVVSDVLVNRNIFSTTITRRIMTLIAAFGPKFFLGLVSCITCSLDHSAKGLFSCAMGTMGTYYAGVKLIPLDMSPNYAATLMGFANGLGSLAAVIASYFRDFSFESKTFKDLGTILWALCTLFISGEVQGFDNIAKTSIKSD